MLSDSTARRKPGQRAGAFRPHNTLQLYSVIGGNLDKTRHALEKNTTKRVLPESITPDNHKRAKLTSHSTTKSGSNLKAAIQIDQDDTLAAAKLPVDRRRESPGSTSASLSASGQAPNANRNVSDVYEFTTLESMMRADTARIQQCRTQLKSSHMRSKQLDTIRPHPAAAASLPSIQANSLANPLCIDGTSGLLLAGQPRPDGPAVQVVVHKTCNSSTSPSASPHSKISASSPSSATIHGRSDVGRHDMDPHEISHPDHDRPINFHNSQARTRTRTTQLSCDFRLSYLACNNYCTPNHQPIHLLFDSTCGDTDLSVVLRGNETSMPFRFSIRKINTIDAGANSPYVICHGPKDTSTYLAFLLAIQFFDKFQAHDFLEFVDVNAEFVRIRRRDDGWIRDSFQKHVQNFRQISFDPIDAGWNENLLESRRADRHAQTIPPSETAADAQSLQTKKRRRLYGSQGPSPKSAISWNSLLLHTDASDQSNEVTTAGTELAGHHAESPSKSVVSMSMQNRQNNDATDTIGTCGVAVSRQKSLSSAPMSIQKELLERQVENQARNSSITSSLPTTTTTDGISNESLPITSRLPSTDDPAKRDEHPAPDSASNVSPHDGSATRRTTRAIRKTLRDPSPLPLERYSHTHGLGDPWKISVRYPATGRGRATVQFEDLQRLDDGEFLNDNLVEFAMRWSVEQYAQARAKVYCFNTFFYSTLTSGKGRHINYPAVQKWTKDVDIFSYDYILVPVNESLHWYLAIICHPHAVLGSKEVIVLDDSQDIDCVPEKNGHVCHDEHGSSLENLAGKTLDSSTQSISPQTEQNKHSAQATPSSSSPIGQMQKMSLGDEADSVARKMCRPETTSDSRQSQKRKRGKNTVLRKYRIGESVIFILDSLGGTHSATIANLKDYLVKEAADKLKKEIQRDLFKGAHAKSGIPQQDTLYDCGIFICGYIDKILSDPQTFGHKLMKQEFDLKRDWSNMTPSRMRNEIRARLQTLAKQQEDARKKLKQERKLAKRAIADVKTSVEEESIITGLASKAGFLKPTIEAAADTVQSTDSIAGQSQHNQSPSGQELEQIRQTVSPVDQRLEDAFGVQIAKKKALHASQGRIVPGKHTLSSSIGGTSHDELVDD